jgi:hypothetical protein
MLCATLGLLCQLTDADAKAAADIAIAEMKRTEVVPHATPFASLVAGYHSADVAGFAELRVGYGKGKLKRNLLLPTTTLWRVSAAIRGTYGRSDSVSASLLGGWGKVSYLGFTAELGPDIRISPDVSFGPIVTLGLRVGPFGLHTSVWSHLSGSGEHDGGLMIGLGYTLEDFVSSSEIAKDRAEAELKARGIPVP